MKIEIEAEELLELLNGMNDKMFEKVRLCIGGYYEEKEVNDNG